MPLIYLHLELPIPSSRCGKATTWEGGIRVPALIHWQGVIEPRKSTELFSALDIMPSVMSIIGHPIKYDKFEDFHGIDQSKMIFIGQKVIEISFFIKLLILKSN